MTKSDQARLDAIHAMACAACEIEGVQQPNPTEADHLVDKGTRKHSGGHMATIPLCRWHHRGVTEFGVNAAEMACAFGPSFALEKRKAVAKYGAKRDLLAKVDAKIARKAVA